MKKKIFLLLKTILYLLLLLIILKTILELTTSFQNKFNLPLSLEILYFIPPLISSITAPIWLNILFFINILLLIVEPLYIKTLNYKIRVLLNTINISLNSILLIYLFLNFKFIEIDKSTFLPLSSIFYYRLTFYLFLTYFIILFYNIYSKFKFIKKCSK